jgi:hypothetical protein
MIIDFGGALTAYSADYCGIAGRPTNRMGGRNCDNRLVREKLKCSPSTGLIDGLRPTYA